MGADILVVDDEAEIRDLVAGILTADVYAVPAWFPPVRAFAAILLSPLPLIVWGGINWTRQTTRDGGWRALLLDGLALVVVVVSIGVVFRFRRGRGWWLLVLAAASSLAIAAAAWLVGTMAITGRWW